MVTEGKITGEYEVISGFLCGTLVMGGLLAFALPGVFWSLAAPLLVIFGVLLFLDDIFPYGRQPYLWSESSGFIAGCILVGISFISGFIAWFLAPVTILSAVKLIVKVLKKLGKV